MVQRPVDEVGEDLVDGCVTAALACGQRVQPAHQQQLRRDLGVRPRSGSSKAVGALAATCNERT